MLTQIKLTNFKCFKQETIFPLSKFNLLTGVNGSGKSTLLQSLLLMRQSIEYDAYTTQLVLNGSCVNLGNFDEVRNREVSVREPIFFELFIKNINNFEGLIRYQLESGHDGMSLSIPKIEIQQHPLLEVPIFPKGIKTYSLHYQPEKNLYQLSNKEARVFRLIKLVPYYSYSTNPLTQDDSQPSILHKDEQDNFDYFSFRDKQDQDSLNLEKIHYISSDRIGPQELYEKTLLPKFAHVDAIGRFAISLLHHMSGQLVDERLCLGEDAKTLMTQTEAWLGKILTPLRLEVLPLTRNTLELRIGHAKPSNVGFGYSTILPIIISGLIAKPGEKLIVENPEIHLHPKAQSALIQFLVAVANTGVQVFVESHSDHVLNALRIAVLRTKLLAEDVSILSFQANVQEPVNQLPIQKDGRIETWPTDFFDQMDNDLNALLGIEYEK